MVGGDWSLESGESPLLLSEIWISRWLMKKTVVARWWWTDGWLLELGRLREGEQGFSDLGLEDFDFFRFCVVNLCERLKNWRSWFCFAFCVWVTRCDYVNKPILAWHVELEGIVAQHFLFWYRRVKSRFCVILPDFTNFRYLWTI